MDLPARIGRYEVELELGHGDIGRVLLARDPVLGRQVVVKVLRAELDLPAESRARLTDRIRQDACAAASVSHPAIVTLHDMGEDERVGLFLVFELIHGPTLREKLVRGPLAASDVAPLARALGSALTHAHGRGLVHRDVKPENVMLGPTGPKLTDFGWVAADAVAGGEAGRSFVSSTPAYSAPEVLASGAFSAYGDQFSLAATLFEALTGLRAFPGGDAASVAARVATSKHPAATSLLPGLRAFPHVDPIFDRALSKEARNRFVSCEAFTSVLASELEGSNVATLTTPLPRSSIVPRATRRWQNSAALLGVVVIVLLAVAGRYHRPSDAHEIHAHETIGVSLKSVASAFASCLAGAGRGIPAAPHHSHAGASASSSTATSNAAALPPTTPSGNMTAVPLTEGAAVLAPAAALSAAIPQANPSEASSAGLDSGPR
jgi:serine/threonine-protein kinase